VSAAVPGVSQLTMVLEVLKNVSAFVSSPVTLGWLHDKLVKSQEAQAMLTKAIAAEPDEPEPIVDGDRPTVRVPITDGP